MAVPSVVETHGVNIDFAPISVSQHDVGVGRTLNELEPVLGEDLARPGHVVDANDEVEVVVRPRLFTKEGVHAPSPVEPGFNLAKVKAVQHLDDVAYGHRHVTGSLAGAPGTSEGLVRRSACQVIEEDRAPGRVDPISWKRGKVRLGATLSLAIRALRLANNSSDSFTITSGHSHGQTSSVTI